MGNGNKKYAVVSDLSPVNKNGVKYTKKRNKPAIRFHSNFVSYEEAQTRKLLLQEEAKNQTASGFVINRKYYIIAVETL